MKINVETEFAPISIELTVTSQYERDSLVNVAKKLQRRGLQDFRDFLGAGLSDCPDLQADTVYGLLLNLADKLP